MKKRARLPIALVLLLAACGKSAKSPAPLATTGGSAAAGGSAADAGAGQAGGGAGQAGAGQRPEADPAVTAKYSWHECGRMRAHKPIDAVYGGGGSALVATAAGGLLAFSPGSPFATELVGPAELEELEPFARIKNIIVSPDRRTLVLMLDRSLVVYRATDGLAIGPESKPLVRVELPTLNVAEPTYVVLSADGARMALLGSSSLSVWDVDSGERQGLPSASFAGGLAVTASEVLVSRAGSDAPVIASYSLSGELHEVPLVLPSRPTSEALSPDGATLTVLLGGDSPALVALDTATGQERWRRSAPQRGVWQGNGLVASASAVLVEADALYSLVDGTVLAGLEGGWMRTFGGGAFTDSSALVVSEDHVTEWDLSAGAPVRHYGALGESVRGLDLSRDGRFLAAQGAGTYVWQLDDDFERSLIQATPYAPTFAFNVALAPGGDALVTSGDWVELSRGMQHAQASDPPPLPSSESTGCLSAAWAFSPDGKLVAGGDYGTDVYVRDSHTFEVRQRIAASNCGGAVAFSPDGSRLVTASLEAFDTATWSRVWEVPGQAVEHTREFRQDWVTFGPRGRELLRTRCDDERNNPCVTERFDAASGGVLGSLTGLTGPVARYSPEEHWVVSAGRAQHVPSGALVELDPLAVVSTFDADGNVIAGENDGSLVKLCLDDP